MNASLSKKPTESYYERFLQGDMNAFETIVTEHRKGLMLFINRFVDDLDTAEDIAEDVFVRLLIKKPRYKGDASFKTWLFTMGRNMSIDYLRKHKRTLPTDEINVGAVNDTEAEFFLAERKRTLYKALAILSEEERLLMHLIYIEELGYEQAEKILRIPKKKLYRMARSAKEKLKDHLTKEELI